MENLKTLNSIFQSRIMPPEYQIFFNGTYYWLFEKKGSSWKAVDYMQNESLDKLEYQLKIRGII